MPCTPYRSGSNKLFIPGHIPLGYSTRRRKVQAAGASLSNGSASTRPISTMPPSGSMDPRTQKPFAELSWAGVSTAQVYGATAASAGVLGCFPNVRASITS